MNQLQALLEAETEADNARRAVGAVPEVFRPPNAAAEAHARWEHAHAELRAALNDPELEAGW